MEIKQLEYVLMAAEMGSFNKASEFLYTTQSNVSKVISSLEKELGYRIFKRQGGGVVLTDAGRALFEQSQQIIGILENLKTFKSLENRKCFHLATVTSNMIGNRFAEFVGSRNELEYCMELWEGSISKVIDVVDRGEAGLGLLYIGKKQRESFHTLLQKRGLEFHELIPAQVVVCLSQMHPLAKEKLITREQMKELRFVKYREDSFSHMYHLQQVVSDLHLNEQFAQAVEVDSGSVLMNILRKTDYVHLAFSSLSHFSNEQSDIIEIPLEYDKEGFCLGYIKRSAVALDDTAEDFLKLLVSGICVSGIDS